MADMMTFPDTVEEFMEQYKIVDTDQVYTNGVEMVPIFRMKQWFEHLPTIEERKTGEWRDIAIGEWRGIECTVCKLAWDKRDVPHTLNGKVVWKYCPECGAKMEGDGNA